MLAAVEAQAKANEARAKGAEAYRKERRERAAKHREFDGE